MENNSNKLKQEYDIPKLLDDKFIGLKNTYEDKKGSKLVYILATAFVLVLSMFIGLQIYHTAKNIEQIKAINGNIEGMYPILNEWELIE